MNGAARIAAGLFALACVSAVGAARPAAAATLGPFRPAAEPSRAPSALLPFRTAQALPNPEPPAPAKPPRAAAPAAACQKDDDCPQNNICDAGACRAIEPSTNVFPFYYREGSFREIMLLWWQRKGTTGYTVFAPFYWHFFSPKSDFLAVAPFYWRSQDDARGYKLTVIPPVSWSSEPGAGSFAIWPLFYGSSKYGWAAPLLGTFHLKDPGAGKSSGAALFLYWWRRGPDRAFDLGIPLFVSRRSSARAFTYALPLNFYWRNGDDRNLLALPLFYKNESKNGNGVYSVLGYSSRDGNRISGTALWLYWFSRNVKNGNGYDFLVPLFYRSKDGERRTTVVFPLVWNFSGPTSRTTVVAPLYLGIERGSSYFNALFPVWWSGGDRATGRGFRTLLPLFHYQKDDKAGTATLLTLLGGYSRDNNKGTAAGLVLPFFFYRRDSDGTFKFLSPLYVSHTSRSEASTTRLVSLLFYQRSDPQGSTTVLFPFVWRFRDSTSGASATLVLPFGGHRSGPRDDTTIVLLAWWRSYKPTGWSAGLFPLLYAGNNAGSRHAVVAPLFWHFADAKSATTALVPAFYWRRHEHGWDFGSLPLLFMGRDRDETYAVQFPLFFHFANSRTGDSTTVTPVGYYHRDKDGWSGAAGPLIPLVFARSGKTRSHFALLPLIWHFADRSADKTTTVVFPYWHRRWGNETTDALFPLLHYRRGARPGGSDETSFTLFPLVHYRRDAAARLWVTPLAASARGPNRSGGFVGPYIWYDDRELSLRFIPVLHADITRHATGERTRQFGPWFQIDGPDRATRVLFPLFGRHRDQRETDTWVFPSYFRMRRTNGDAVDALLPLYWRSSFGGKTTTVVTLFYNRTAPGVHNWGLAPLIFRARNQERSITVIPPLLTYRRSEADGERVQQWSALYFHKHDKNNSTTVVFPLYYAWKRQQREVAIGFPLYWHVANAKENRSWTLAGPLFSWSSGTFRTRGLLPLAWYSRDSASGYASNALMPLFYQASGPDHSAFYTLLGGYRRSGPSRLWYATPLLWSSDTINSNFKTLVPLYFRHHNKGTEMTTTVVPPLLYVSRSHPESSLTTALALFWHHHDIASSTTLALPLFYDIHEFHLSRTTVLFPLFVRYYRHADQTTYTLAPLFYRRSTPTDTTMVGFPLLWDFKRGLNRTTLVLPVYAHWQRPGYRSTLVIPSYYHQEGLRDDGTPDGTYRRFVGVVVPFYDSAVKRPGDFAWNILGGLVGRERIGSHRYLRLLWFLNFETGSAPRAQTAWYSQPSRAPRKAAPRGLAVAGF
jgi:hypothetical protein